MCMPRSTVVVTHSILGERAAAFSEPSGCVPRAVKKPGARVGVGAKGPWRGAGTAAQRSQRSQQPAAGPALVYSGRLWRWREFLLLQHRWQLSGCADRSLPLESGENARQAGPEKTVVVIPAKSLLVPGHRAGPRPFDHQLRSGINKRTEKVPLPKCPEPPPGTWNTGGSLCKLFCFHLIDLRAMGSWWPEGEGIGSMVARGSLDDKIRTRLRAKSGLAGGARPGATLRLGTVISDGTNWSPLPCAAGRITVLAVWLRVGRGPGGKGHQQMGPSAGETVSGGFTHGTVQSSALQPSTCPPESRQSIQFWSHQIERPDPSRRTFAFTSLPAFQPSAASIQHEIIVVVPSKGGYDSTGRRPSGVGW